MWDIFTSHQSKVTVCGTLSPLSMQKSLCVGHSHLPPSKSHCQWDTFPSLQAKVTVCEVFTHLSPSKSHCVWDTLTSLQAKVTACGTFSPFSKQKSLCVGHSHLSASKSHCSHLSPSKVHCVWDTNQPKIKHALHLKKMNKMKLYYEQVNV